MFEQQITVSVFKRAGREVFEMQYRDPMTGRKVRKSTGEKQRSKAARVAATWEKELRAGIDHRVGAMPWEQFRLRYEDEHLAGLAATTDTKVSSVFNLLEKHCNPQRIGDVTTDRLTRYVKELRDAGRAETTIKGNLAHLRAALAWAVDVGLLAIIPKMPKLQRAKSSKVMKGRPITGEEFDRMSAKVVDGLAQVSVDANKSTKAKKPGTTRPITSKAKDAYRARQRAAAEATAESYRYLLRGLWWSGLRLGEALELHWSDPQRLRIDLSCRHPMLRIPAELEKGNKDRLLPIAPEFAAMLAETPPERRHGFVFNPGSLVERCGRLSLQQVMRAIACIGKAAGVKVDEKGEGEAAKVKYASAHDLRRSFGERWAKRVMPQVLMELMRHESIETTLRYYVGRNAQATAGVLWEAAGMKPETGVGAILGASPEPEAAASIADRRK